MTPRAVRRRAVPAVRLEGVEKHYGSGETLVRAVDGVTLDVARGEFVSVVGRSGSGKTTLLDVVGLLMRPTAGRVFIDGEDADGMSDSQRAILRSHRLGFIFQDFNLLDTLSALDNVLLPVRYAGGDKRAAKSRAWELLEEVGMADRAHHRPNQLSGGEKQRISIARALVNDPSIVLGDEPTGNLDTETSQQIAAFMRRANRDHGVTFVIVTHDMELAGRTDRIVRLRDGRVETDAATTRPRKAAKPAVTGRGAAKRKAVAVRRRSAVPRTRPA